MKFTGLDTLLLKIKTASKKELYHNEWVSLFEKDGYVYSHETRCGGKIVAVLGYREKDDKLEIVGRFEKTPAHSQELKLASLTGGVEDKSTEETAIIEMKEEAGIDITKDELEDLGQVMSSKSSDTIYYLFAVDCSKKDIKKGEGDGSEGEKDAYCEWVSIRDAINSFDSVLHSLIIKKFSYYFYR